jgi:hypothetical protein
MWLIIEILVAAVAAAVSVLASHENDGDNK